MKAVAVKSFSGPDKVELVDLPEPIAGMSEVLIDVRAAGVAFHDLLQTRGIHQLKHALPFVPGSEFSGVVLQAPADAVFSVGDRVVALAMAGGYAERAVAAVDMTFPLPPTVSFELGAAIPANYLTAHYALIDRGGMKPGDAVLIHGAGGGIGTAAIQVAKAFGAGLVIAVASTHMKREVAAAAGADLVVAVDEFKDAALGATGGRGVDIVVDPVGSDRFVDSLRSLDEHGRLLVLGFAGGTIPTITANRLLLGNLDVIGVNWGAHAFRNQGFAPAAWADILPHVESGAFTPPIEVRLPLTDARTALGLFDRREAIGKVILTVPVRTPNRTHRQSHSDDQH